MGTTPAGCFGLPDQEFASVVYSFWLDSFVALKAERKSSVGMMIKRCKSLGMLREETSQRLWRGLASRGWRQSEPLEDELEDELEHEYPSLLSDSIRL